jgi:membrane-anchored mycosin MYCP
VSRVTATAGLAIASCLVAWSALAVPAAAATASGTPAHKASTTKASTTKKKGKSGTTHKSSGNGGVSSPGGPLPQPVAGCLGMHGNPAPRGTPWAQQALDYQSVWQFTQGAGVTVAVIDSGVDANSQFGDRVVAGQTFAAAQAGPIDGDCVGHGTSVAGIIAAAPKSGISFAGVAPQAKILSFKVTNVEQDFASGPVADAIVDAVDDHASVINLSLAAPNTAQLRSAVDLALRHNVVVVAAAGNDGSTPGTGPVYPAAYPGVLSVGAVDASGDLADFSDTHTPVSVTAPGVNITATYPGVFPDSYTAGIQGTSFATPFVAGVAALVRARYPNLTAAQVTARIEETADGAAGPGTGNGLVNPVQAVTAVLPASMNTVQTTTRQQHVSVNRASPDRSETVVAVAVTAGAFGMAALVIAVAAVITAGRRRRWRPDGQA